MNTSTLSPPGAAGAVRTDRRHTMKMCISATAKPNSSAAYTIPENTGACGLKVVGRHARYQIATAT